ncbi:hypothetical protein BM1_06625 [Bipolaris maydis]|nr:hypothetical protein BM1_06625 [Bipolaris maydis]
MALNRRQWPRGPSQFTNVAKLAMTTNRHKYFRWTRRTAWITFAYVALVPGLLGAAGYWAEVSLKMHA